MFYLAALRPAIRRHGAAPPELLRAIGERFRQTVDLAMWVLVVTGALLVYDRLTQEIGLSYALVLGLKIGLSAVMFLIAIGLGRRATRRRAPLMEGAWSELLPARLARATVRARASWARIGSPTNILFALGPVVILLGLLLRSLAG